jgi:hypothetical protein
VLAGGLAIKSDNSILGKAKVEIVEIAFGEKTKFAGKREAGLPNSKFSKRSDPRPSLREAAAGAFGGERL